MPQLFNTLQLPTVFQFCSELLLDCVPLSEFQDESLPLSSIIVSRNHTAIISIMKHWDRRLLVRPWDVIGRARANRGKAFFFCEIASVLGTVNWSTEKWCDNSPAWFGKGNGLKVTFWRIKRQNYIFLPSPLSFTQRHEMNGWDRVRKKCQCKCLQLK